MYLVENVCRDNVYILFLSDLLILPEEVLRGSGNVCYLGHLFIGSKKIRKNLHLETFLAHFKLSVK